MVTPKDVVDAIPSWSLKQVMELVDGIKAKFDISDVVVAPAVSAASAPAAAEAVEEKSEFTVVLVGFGEGAKLSVIKLVKAIDTSLSLVDAKKVVDGLSSTPYELKTGIPKADAEKLKKEVEEAGGVVEIK